MPTHIDTKNFKFSYDARAISTFDYKLFLHHDVVEMKLLTILADLSAVDPKTVLTELIIEIKRVVVEELARGKYINQLKALAQLRDLGPILEEIMDEIKDFFVMEKDPYYRIGERKGEIAKNLENARKMKELGISILLIAKTTGLTREEIRHLKQ